MFPRIFDSDQRVQHSLAFIEFKASTPSGEKITFAAAQQKQFIVMDLPERLASDQCRLPTEVLCHIFIHCLPKTDYTRPQSQSPPILLTRICRRWREVAVDMPSLWCRLSIAPYVHQIYSLNIAFGQAVAFETLFDDLPALQELHLRVRVSCCWQYVRDTLLSVSPPISRRSTLRTLKLEERSFSILDLNLLSRLDPVWAHLTNVTIYFCKQHVVIRLLQLTPNLSSFNICGIIPDHFSIKPEPLTHTSIQSLSITDSCYCNRCYPQGLDSPPPFLNTLTLPNLRVLNVGRKSWTGEELKAVRSVTVGSAIWASYK
ncbi:hypothetical protein EV702DRAFT_1088781 [Suillus placidus]|uniref:F-box domain-containing protein n=1 Tax=Suillus placidus TaxID=48579 RepID=A0A9P6ZZB9_9AGAM|nr:hypothetical protein EV702DRAFT_1088781 [Suillus placidus]